MAETHSSGGRQRRTARNRERYGTIPQRAEEAVQLLYLAGGPVSAGDISDGLDWPPSITGGVLQYLQQEGKAVRHSGGKTTWDLTGRERDRQRALREPRG